MRMPSNGSGKFNVFESDEPVKSVFDDMITEEYLQQVAGTEDLSTVTCIQLKIDTSYQSLLDIGDLLKRLDHLTLNGSKISSVRDLGVGLKDLISLSINDCGLSELDGIGMLTNLTKLSARDNDIEDVTALALHETIEVNLIISSLYISHAMCAHFSPNIRVDSTVDRFAW
jgi:Leucine-rich repeat (LRR) protein